MSNNIKNKALGGMIWKFFEKAGAQIIQLIIQIVLARLLFPEEYGLVGLLTIFISISDTFILQGLTTALIQKYDADETDFSSVFYANIVVSLVLYVILYFSAPYVSVFYNEPKLTAIMRVLSLNVVIGAFSAVHNAVLSRNLDFKKSFYRNILNVLTQGVVGITLAYLGFGAWAVVFSKISGVTVGAVVLWLTVKWFPRRCFSFVRVRNMFSYSSKILGTSLLNTIFNNIHSIIIGHFYTAADLGFYQRGQQIPQTVMTSIDGSMSEVLYPVFSKSQKNLEFLKEATRKSIRLSMYIVCPILFGLLAVAKNLTLLLLTERWLPSVPFMQLACLVCLFWPLSHRTNALNAMGRSDVTFRLSLIGKSITLVLIFACVKFGMYAIMLGSLISSLICFWITSYYANKYLKYSLKEVLADIIPNVLLAGVMCLIVLLVGEIKLNIFLTLLLQIFAGALVYILGSTLFKMKTFYYILDMINPIIKKFINKR